MSNEEALPKNGLTNAVTGTQRLEQENARLKQKASVLELDRDNFARLLAAVVAHSGGEIRLGEIHLHANHDPQFMTWHDKDNRQLVIRLKQGHEDALRQIREEG